MKRYEALFYSAYKGFSSTHYIEAKNDRAAIAAFQKMAAEKHCTIVEVTNEKHQRIS